MISPDSVPCPFTKERASVFPPQWKVDTIQTNHFLFFYTEAQTSGWIGESRISTAVCLSLFRVGADFYWRFHWWRHSVFYLSGKWGLLLNCTQISSYCRMVTGTWKWNATRNILTWVEWLTVFLQLKMTQLSVLLAKLWLWSTRNERPRQDWAFC